MPISLIVGNWKMNTSLADARVLATNMRPGLDAVAGVDKVVCPPFIALSTVREALDGSNVSLGAQNMYHQDKGAYTGEISSAMLAQLCEYVILGHSERRGLFGETDAIINLKLRAAVKARLTPILCVGESLQHREQGEAETVVAMQLKACLKNVRLDSGLVVAYEPIWAIGTGRAATPNVAQAMASNLRKTLASIYGEYGASNVPLLYGGSTSPANIADFVREKDLDGALVGGASLDPNSFVEMAHLVAISRT